MSGDTRPRILALATPQHERLFDRIVLGGPRDVGASGDLADTERGGADMAKGIPDSRPACSIDGCGRPHEARGWCGKHYQRWRKYGDPRRERPTVEQRFWEKVDRRGPDECWPWLGFCQPSGYGRFGVGGRAGGMDGAHRVSWRIAHGQPIPGGWDIDHLCRNPQCVNPRHLEAVTHRVNCRRGIAGEVNARRQRSITHCPRGHAYDEENTSYSRSGSRRCKACMREKAKERYYRQRGAA